METGGPMVIDSEELKRIIDDIGIPKFRLANNLEISVETLDAKVSGDRDFWWHEVILLRKALRLTDEEFKKIFGL